jgi:hypothetical protein
MQNLCIFLPIQTAHELPETEFVTSRNGELVQVKLLKIKADASQFPCAESELKNQTFSVPNVLLKMLKRILFQK